MAIDLTAPLRDPLPNPQDVLDHVQEILDHSSDSTDDDLRERLRVDVDQTAAGL